MGIEGISADEFRGVLRLFAAGVSIVTSRSGDRTHGMTVSAFSSVSADPPLVGVFVDRAHTLNELLAGPDPAFAVSFLAEDHEGLSNRFAFVTEEDRFLEGSWIEATTGCPVLADALAWLDCRLELRHEAGSHMLYLGRVVATDAPRPDAAPLVYWNRGYRRFRE